MNAGLLKKTTATLGAAVLTVALGACTTHRAVDTTAQTTGEIRTEQSATNQTPSTDQTLGTVAAPANAQGVTAPSTPAVISGPAAVDKSGNAYTSSSAGGAGNASGTGLNTNVQIRAPKTGESSVTVTQSPATTVETTPAPVVVETTPAPVVVETTPAPAPAPAPVVIETQTTTTETVPMTSSTQTTTEEKSTTTTTQTKHRRMRKD